MTTKSNTDFQQKWTELRDISEKLLECTKTMAEICGQMSHNTLVKDQAKDQVIQGQAKDQVSQKDQAVQDQSENKVVQDQNKDQKVQRDQAIQKEQKIDIEPKENVEQKKVYIPSEVTSNFKKNLEFILNNSYLMENFICTLKECGLCIVGDAIPLIVNGRDYCGRLDLVACKGSKLLEFIQYLEKNLPAKNMDVYGVVGPNPHMLDKACAREKNIKIVQTIDKSKRLPIPSRLSRNLDSGKLRVKPLGMAMVNKITYYKCEFLHIKIMEIPVTKDEIGDFVDHLALGIC